MIAETIKAILAQAKAEIKEIDDALRHMMYVKVISDDATIKDFHYEPLRCGALYKADVSNKYYTYVFFEIDGEERTLVVYNRHLIFIDRDEHREEKLKELGI